MVAPKHCIEARSVNDLFMTYKIPLAILAATRTLAKRVNAEFTVMPRSLIFLQNSATAAQSFKSIGGVAACFPLIVLAFVHIAHAGMQIARQKASACMRPFYRRLSNAHLRRIRRRPLCKISHLTALHRHDQTN